MHYSVGNFRMLEHVLEIEGLNNPYFPFELSYHFVLFCINLCLLFWLLFKSLILSVDICLELIGPLG